MTKIRGLPPWLRESPGEILDAISRGLAVPEGQLPTLPKAARRPVLTEGQKRREAALKAWRAAEAARLAVEVAVVLPQRLIDRLTETPPRDLEGLAAIDGLRRWRREAFGAAILAALRAVP